MLSNGENLELKTGNKQFLLENKKKGGECIECDKIDCLAKFVFLSDALKFKKNRWTESLTHFWLKANLKKGWW